MTMILKNKLALCVVVSVTMAFGCTEDPLDKTTRIKEEIRSIEAKLQGRIPIVTYAQYDRINHGMSYKQVCDIIGVRGTELSNVNIAGYETVMYSWSNLDGSNVNAMFQNHGLISKAQFGLR